MRLRQLSSKLLLTVLVAILLNMSGAIVGKYFALNLERWHIVAICVALFALIYASRFVFWIWAGRHYQLSFLYPFISLAYVMSLAVGYVLFQEEVTIQRLLGSLIIVVGVAIISGSQNKQETRP
ncbi:MAG: hypothetical protein EA392_05270 [Cryomorphaceae bacterium]|nr:MAG: hypothetical protein EA392_05270 [Cryomorphaceae bacterium]